MKLDLSSENLVEYQTLSQKSIFFNQFWIETEKEFNDIFERYQNCYNIIFRGLNESKYRLYSKMQRKWINEKLIEKFGSYLDLLVALANNARREQNNILPRFLEYFKEGQTNDLAILSYLQHYGCPTPLLDWTLRFSTAFVIPFL